MNFVRWSVTAALMASACPAIAAEAAAGAGAEAEQPSIVVTGQRDEYGVRRTSTATRTDTALRDIPQALTVISESQIEDQDLRSIADVLTFVPGATVKRYGSVSFAGLRVPVTGMPGVMGDALARSSKRKANPPVASPLPVTVRM